jgi:hypothetical protein
MAGQLRDWHCLSIVMPALVAGIHVFGFLKQHVDGRDEPGHDRGESRAKIRDIACKYRRP